MIKVVTVCGAGVGSSMMMRLFTQQILDGKDDSYLGGYGVFHPISLYPMPLTENICFGAFELSPIFVLRRPMMTSKLFESLSFRLLQL